MKHKLNTTFFLLLFSLNPGLFSQNSNVLFIAVDDLNDYIGCMGGHPQAITPNLDKLAGEGVLFLNNHCQAPICGPSRASLMTGLHPNTTGIYLHIDDDKIMGANEAAAGSVFMPDWFEKFGYHTIGAGKIYHQGDKANSFDEFAGFGDVFGPRPEKRMKWPPEGMPVGTSTDWGAFPERDEDMHDYKVASFIIEQLQREHEKPFFLAAGFGRPHVPWHVPQKWFDLYPVKDVRRPAYLPTDMDDVPEMGIRVNAVPPMPTTEWAIANDEWENILQAYLACVSFVDAQVGRVLDALKNSAYAENTIIVLWTDHGYHLGEKNRFAKHAIWERSTRTPLIFKAPGAMPGGRCHAPTQLLDIYPTLLDLCGIPANPQLDGNSLVPLLENPEASWDRIAITSYGVGNLSMRDRACRYIVYEDGSEELYDMEEDPNEWTNQAANPDYSAVLARFRAARPDEQAPLAKDCHSGINEYWKAVEAENRKR